MTTFRARLGLSLHHCRKVLRSCDLKLSPDYPSLRSCRPFAQSLIGRAFGTEHLPNVRHFQPWEVETASRSPWSLTAVEHVVIGPVRYKVSSEGDRIEPVAVEWERCNVLKTLHSMEHIKFITVDMHHMFNETTDLQHTPTPEFGPPDPLLAFGECRHGWEEPSLCTWSHPHLPKLSVTHFPTVTMMDICHPYRFDKEGWKTLVAANLHIPTYPAFDYTAEFYSNDLSQPQRGGLDYGDEEFEDLRPLGSGWRYPSGGSFFDFAQDMMKNMAYFSKYPDAWEPDLYSHMMRKGCAGSNLW